MTAAGPIGVRKPAPDNSSLPRATGHQYSTGPHTGLWLRSTRSLHIHAAYCYKGGSVGSRVVSVLDSSAVGPVHQAVKLVATLLRVAGGNCGPGGKQWQPTAGFMTHVTCRPTAKNRDQHRNPTLGNRVWATFTFF